MTKEDINNPKPSNEVDNIRKILFGDQVTQFEERFISIESSINQLRSENRNLRQALESEVTMREKAIEDLTNLINEELKKRDESWAKYLAFQDNLLASLLQIISQYQNNTQTFSVKK